MGDPSQGWASPEQLQELVAYLDGRVVPVPKLLKWIQEVMRLPAAGKGSREGQQTSMDVLASASYLGLVYHIQGEGWTSGAGPELEAVGYTTALREILEHVELGSMTEGANTLFELLWNATGGDNVDEE